MHRLFIQNIKREFRLREVKLLFFMVAISAFMLSATCEVNVLIKNKVRQESAVILGADLILKSSYPIEEKYLRKAKELELITTKKIDFYTMTLANNDLLLINVNAIEDPFPLSNQLYIKKEGGAVVATKKPPASNEVWVENYLLNRLNIKLGDAITIGEKTFKITAVIDSKLNQSGNFINFSPKVLMNLEDLSSLNVLQAGSRASYQLLLGGDLAKERGFSTFFKEQSNDHQALISPKESNLTRSVYDNILNFINISMMFSVMLSALAILLACKRYAYYQLKRVALMKVFGHASTKIITLSLTIIRIISFFAILLGVLMSMALKPVLCDILGINYQIEPLLATESFVFSMVTTVILLVIFIVASFIKLKEVVAIDLFQKKEPPDSLAAILCYCLSAVVVLAAVYYLTGSLRISGMFFYLLLSFFLLSWVALYLLCNLFLIHYKNKPLLSSYYLKRLKRNFSISVLQVFSITSALSVAFCLWLLQDSLFKHWDKFLFQNVPNVFLINIERSQVDSLNAFFVKNKLSHSPIYPMVRGRLVKKNGTDIKKFFKDRATPRSLRRELNLSTTETLADNNKIIEGEFINHRVNGGNSVSVEAGMASRVGIKLGDNLTFSVSGRELSAKVTSIRTVEWTSFNPNFFMIFNLKALNNYPKTFISSFNLEHHQEQTLSRLVKAYPNVTAIDLSGIIASIQQLVLAIKQALLFVVGFALLGGAVVITLLYLSFDVERQKDAKIFFALGLTKAKISSLQWKEPAFIGLTAGLAVSLCSFISNYLLIKGILGISFNPSLFILTLPVLISTSLMTLLFFMLRARS